MIASENTDADVLLRFYLQIPAATDTAILDMASVVVTQVD